MEKSRHVTFRLSEALWAKLADACEFREMSPSEFLRDVLSARLDGKESVVRLTDVVLKLLEAVVELSNKVDKNENLLLSAGKVSADTAKMFLQHMESDIQFRQKLGEFTEGVGDRFKSYTERSNRQSKTLTEILQKLVKKVDRTTDFAIALCALLNLEVEETDGKLCVRPKG